MKKSLKVVPGGGVVKNQILNKTSPMLLCLLIMALLLALPVSAKGIPTQSLKKILQINGDEEGLLDFPSDVAVLAGKIYVVDGGQHRVVVFDSQGKYLFQFGGKGSGKGQMNFPVGIDASGNKRIYVADSGNHRIQVFSAKGEYLSSFKVHGKKKPTRPIDVLRHTRTGHIFVSAGNHRMMAYSPKGKRLYQWGGNGMNQGEFRYPATISEMKDGRIAVVDVLNSRVQVFDVDGRASMLVGQWGVLPGQLMRPKGVAIDRKGQFYISDSYMNLVQSFSDTGDFISVLGDKGKPYKMTTPVGMTVNKNKLYIVEMRKHRVSVYQLVD